MRPGVDPAEYPFRDRWLSLTGGTVHYVDEGLGQPVLLLHGNPTWSFLYRNAIKDLSRDFRCVAPDYPGFGYSRPARGFGFTPQEHAGCIVELLDALAVDRFLLVAHDWGGPIGLAAALSRPGRAAGTVLCNTWCWAPDVRARLFSLLVGGPAGRVLNLRLNFFARVILPLGIAVRARKTPAVLQAYVGRFPTPASRMGTHVFPRMIRKAADWLRETERGLRLGGSIPAELVWGMRDPVFGRRACIDRWMSHFPQAGVDRIPHAGHYVPEDEPGRVANAVRRLQPRMDPSPRAPSGR